jgi:hypothetical protein
MCGIALVKHAKEHNRQQYKIFNEINRNAQRELLCAADGTGPQGWRPYDVTLNSLSY